MIGKILRLLLVVCVLLFGVLAVFRGAAHVRETETHTVSAPETGRFLSTREGAVFVQERGPADGIPLLFAHGTGAWSGLWMETVDAMAAEGYRAIAFDLTPFGFSDRARDGDYSRIRQAERILAIVEALDVTPILVAHSFGAAPGSEAALRNPDRFAGLVLVAGAVGLTEAKTAKSLPLPLKSESARRWIGTASALNPLLTRALLRPMLHQTEAATDARIEILQRPMRREGTTEAFADWLPSLIAPDTRKTISTQSSAWADYGQPLALIWGREDRLTPPEQAETLAEITKADLYWLENVGHIPQIEAPEAFQAHLLTALSQMR
ncbi:alpha/beta fold hydrolase [Primorskyibacter sp. S187A]|uniref:alpha/beta fold hydrolase n=1 Tax=Primorskyibacter sp. S187A TaxID=3415130 RepID=UPI003C7BCE3A